MEVPMNSATESTANFSLRGFHALVIGAAAKPYRLRYEAIAELRKARPLEERERPTFNFPLAPRQSPFSARGQTRGLEADSALR